MKNITLFHLCSHFYPATSIGGPIYCGLELLIKLDTIVPQYEFIVLLLILINGVFVLISLPFAEILPSNFVP